MLNLRGRYRDHPCKNRPIRTLKDEYWNSLVEHRVLTQMRTLSAYSSALFAKEVTAEGGERLCADDTWMRVTTSRRLDSLVSVGTKAGKVVMLGTTEERLLLRLNTNSPATIAAESVAARRRPLLRPIEAIRCRSTSTFSRSKDLFIDIYVAQGDESCESCRHKVL